MSITKNANTTTVLYIICAVALTAFLMLLNNPDVIFNSTNDLVKNSWWDDSVWQVENYLMYNLKDPDSYESIEWGPVIKKFNNYTVRHRYRAKNSYGGYVISDAFYELDQQGNVIDVLELD